MYFFTLNDFLMAGRMFHSANISELTEALSPDTETERRPTTPPAKEVKPVAVVK